MYHNHFNYRSMRPLNPPEYPFHNYDNNYGPPQSMFPYQRYPMRTPPPDWSTRWVNQQISKSQDMWLRPWQNNHGQRKGNNKPNTSKAKPMTETNQTQTEHTKNEKIMASQPQNKLPSRPKLSAKEMWETSYREQVPDDNAYLELPESPEMQELEAVQPQMVDKRKRKSHKFRRGQYWKKGKKKNSDSTPDSNSEVYPKTCNLCEIQLENKDKADEHYQGKLHKKNSNDFLTGQDSNSINNCINNIKGSMVLPTNTPPCLSWDEPGATTTDRSVNTVRFCALCSVRMTSLVTAKQHYDGKYHAKRIRIVERGQKPHRKPFKATHFVSGGTLSAVLTTASTKFTYTPSAYQQTTINAAVGTTSSLNMKTTLPPEFANSMTPSGQFYCQTCNITIEHVGNLRNHLQSKAHKLAKMHCM